MNFSGAKLHLFMVFFGNCVGSGLPPDGKHVCLKPETYPATIEVTVQREKPPTKVFCLQPLKGFKCKKRSNEWETVKVPKVVNRTRIVHQCCDGYREEKGEVHQCVPDCPRGCVHGECVRPGACVCAPGYYGPQCRKACRSGKWGENCHNKCRCPRGVKCDPVFGCVCPPGYMGDGCRLPCPEGQHGPSCRERCACGGGPCDSRTGECLGTTETITTDDAEGSAVERSVQETTTHRAADTDATPTTGGYSSQTDASGDETTGTMDLEKEAGMDPGGTPTSTTDGEEETSTKVSTTEAYTAGTNAAGETATGTSTTGSGTTLNVPEGVTSTEETASTTDDFVASTATTITWTSTTNTPPSVISTTDTPPAIMSTMTSATETTAKESTEMPPPLGATAETGPAEESSTPETPSTTVSAGTRPPTQGPQSTQSINRPDSAGAVAVGEHKIISETRDTAGGLGSQAEDIVLESGTGEVNRGRKVPADTEDKFRLSYFIPSLAAVSGISIVLFLIAARWLLVKHRKKATHGAAAGAAAADEEEIFRWGTLRKGSDATFWVNNCVENPAYLADVNVNNAVPVLRTFKPLPPEDGTATDGSPKPFPR